MLTHRRVPQAAWLGGWIADFGRPVVPAVPTASWTHSVAPLPGRLRD